MKKVLFTSIVALLSSTVAHADIIECVFTEPFVKTVYSMTQSTLTITDIDNKEVIKSVSFQIKSPSVFELVSKDGQVLQTLTLNQKGSDGMSDTLYPYDVKDTRFSDSPQYGGCTSNYLKAVKQN